MTLLDERPAPGADQRKPEIRPRFQTDIEGLRALAVLGVVAFHASVPFLPGGFVGVDVFLVISGYLITGLLLREARSTGRIRFGQFFARRARRILPAAAVVVVATSIAAWFMLPMLSVYRSSVDLLASAIYLANWRFIAAGTDYLSASNDHSVVLHFWSLAVEEQFYLVWPALVLLAVLLAQRWTRTGPWMIVLVLGSVAAASLVASLILTTTQPALAYMATYTRGWQFGAGALLAIFTTSLSERGGQSRALRTLGLAIGWGGILMIGYAMVEFDETTPYPGTAALVPTLGACAIIAGGLLWGTSGGSVGRALSWGPVRTIGRLSFAWYLWHWPLLVLVEAKTGTLSWQSRCVVMVAALLLAVVTLVVLEEPVMKAKVVRKKVAAGVAVGLIATVLAAAGALSLGTVALNNLAEGNQTTSTASFASVFGVDSGSRSGSVTPSAFNAHADTPRGDCLVDRGIQLSSDCTFGVTGGTRVVLFGDSHAQQWQPAFEQIALDRGWELHVTAKAGCPVADLIPTPDQSQRFSMPECGQFRQEQISDIVNNIQPSMIIVSSFSYYISDRIQSLAAWNRSLDELRVLDVPIAYIRDTPFPHQQVPDCISSSLDDWSTCAFPQVLDTVREPVITETILGAEPNVSIIDMNGYLCPTSSCQAVLNGTLLYRDDSHITATAARLLTPAMDQALVDAKLVEARS